MREFRVLATFKAKQSEPNLDLVVFDYYLIAAQPDVRISHTLACRHMVFQSVPGTDDDLAVVDPLGLPAGFLIGDQGTACDFRLAKRPGLVRANIGQAVELTLNIEYPYLPRSEEHTSELQSR